jgi:hypothetical protein
MATKTKTKTPKTDAPKLTIKNLKTCRGREGIAFSCIVYVDGVKAAFASDDGNGGEMRIDWTPTRTPGKSIWESPVKDRLEAYCKTLPPHKFPAYDGTDDLSEMPWTIAFLIDHAIDAIETEKKLKRWCKTKVVFHVEGESDETYHTMGLLWAGNEARVRAQLAKEYGKTKVEIINERFA